MTVQLHWQNPENVLETILVDTFQPGNTLWDWIKETMEARKSECPDGWVAMVCSQDSAYCVTEADTPFVANGTQGLRYGDMRDN